MAINRDKELLEKYLSTLETLAKVYEENAAKYDNKSDYDKGLIQGIRISIDLFDKVKEDYEAQQNATRK